MNLAALAHRLGQVDRELRRCPPEPEPEQGTDWLAHLDDADRARALELFEPARLDGSRYDLSVLSIEALRELRELVWPSSADESETATPAADSTEAPCPADVGVAADPTVLKVTGRQAVKLASVPAPVESTEARQDHGLRPLVSAGEADAPNEGGAASHRPVDGEVALSPAAEVESGSSSAPDSTVPVDVEPVREPAGRLAPDVLAWRSRSHPESLMDKEF